MNIFILDESPILAAQWQHDRHVVKMILESAQMLSCAFQTEYTGFTMPDGSLPRFYKLTHQNHPCNLWLRESFNNVIWLQFHFDALIAEYHKRFRKIHACDAMRWDFGNVVAHQLGFKRWIDCKRSGKAFERASAHTPFPLAMPDSYKSDNTVASYRAYYRAEKLSQQHVKWTRCAAIPDIFADRLDLIEANRIQQLPVPVPIRRHGQPITYANPAAIAAPKRFGVRS